MNIDLPNKLHAFFECDSINERKVFLNKERLLSNISRVLFASSDFYDFAFSNMMGALNDILPNIKLTVSPADYFLLINDNEKNIELFYQHLFQKFDALNTKKAEVQDKAPVCLSKDLIFRVGGRRSPNGDGLIDALYVTRLKPSYTRNSWTYSFSQKEVLQYSKKGSWTERATYIPMEFGSSKKSLVKPMSTQNKSFSVTRDDDVKGSNEKHIINALRKNKIPIGNADFSSLFLLLSLSQTLTSLPEQARTFDWWKTEILESTKMGFQIKRGLSQNPNTEARPWFSAFCDILNLSIPRYSSGIDKNIVQTSVNFYNFLLRLKEFDPKRLLKGTFQQDSSISIPNNLSEWLDGTDLGQGIEIARTVWGTPSIRSANFIMSNLSACKDATSICGDIGLFVVANWRWFDLENKKFGSGNEMMAHAREVWRSKGYSDAGWKMLGKMPQEVLGYIGLGEERVASDISEKGLAYHASLRDWLDLCYLTISESPKFGLSPASIGAFLKVLAPSAATHGGEADLMDGNAHMASSGTLCHMLLPKLPAETIRTKDEALAFAAEAEAKEVRLPFILREAIKHLESISKTASYQTSFGNDLVLIRDWLQGSEPGLWNRISDKPTWAGLMRAQRDWHTEIQANPDKDKTKRYWRTIVGSYDEGDLTAFELNSGQGLIDEGKAMHHCVSSYAGRCRKGLNFIFSIRKNGVRVSTLELLPYRKEIVDPENPGKTISVKQFRIGQNNGVCNRSISDKQVLAFCSSVQNRANEESIARFLKTRKNAQIQKVKQNKP